MKLFLFIISFLFTSSAFANNPGVSYQGRIFKPDGYPLEGANVQFRMQVRSPGAENCLLFEEIQTVNMTGSSGIFSITLNDGTGTRLDTPTYQVDRIFANRDVMTLDATRCAAGTTYTPNTADGRKFVVYFKDETMAAYEPLPVMNLNYAPQAMYALEAQKVGTFAVNNILRTVDVSGNPVTAPALNPTQLTNLNNLLAGTSSQYATAADFSTVQTFAKAALPTCGAGEVLKANGTAFSCVVDSAGGSPAYSAITAATATNTIDNTSHAQTWNWSTATTQSPMSLSANALTTGSGLNLTTSSAALNSTNGFLNVANTGASTSGILARMQSNATAGSGLTVLTNGNVGIGTTAPTSAFDIRGPSSASASAISVLNVLGGDSTIAGGVGGGVTITAGNGAASSGKGGAVSISGGATLAGSTGTAGSLVLGGAGITASGSAGITTLTSGNGNNGYSGGAIGITAGRGTGEGYGGSITVAGGGYGGGNGIGGDVTIIGGAKTNSGTDGNVLLATTRGNVGIGTSSPSSSLDVSNSTGAVQTLSRNNATVVSADSIGKIQFWNNDAELTTQKIYGNIEVVADQAITTDAAAGAMVFRTTGTAAAGAPVDRMKITSAGRIAVGVTSPTARLHVYDTSGVPAIQGVVYSGAASGVYGATTGSYSSWGGAGITGQGTNGVRGDVTYGGVANTGAALTGQSTTIVDDGQLLRLQHKTSAFSGTSFLQDMASGTGSFTGNFVEFKNNSISQFVIKSDGSVGIGTTTPQAHLDVNGYARLKTYSGAPPVACSGTYAGAIALTSGYIGCVCNSTSWVRISDGTTACAW